MARSSIVGIQYTQKVADGADLSVAAKQYTFVKAVANQRVNTCGLNGVMLGVQMQLAVGSPQSVMIRQNGTALLKVDGTTPIIANDRLKSDASGRGIKAAAGDVAGAIALEGADVADLVIEVALISPSAAS